ncbi:MAG TPA: response regulator [Verrucomicrobiae bacterium]|jgi:CheY-like chemotaxis protein|nr:response regulator [Verrucomicrobiae bacterium]
MSGYPTILIAEDSENDRMLIDVGFQKAKFPCRLQFVEDGVHATEYLDGLGVYKNRAQFPVPVLLLTDLTMPRMGGFELLAWVHHHKIWRDLPVVIVTGSNQAEDWHRAMELGADSYVVKNLLMRPPPSLFEAIWRLAFPKAKDPREFWAHRVKQVRA